MRAVVAGAGAGGVRRRQRARGAALRHGRAHTRRRTGPGRGDLAARGWRGRAIAQAHPEAVGRGYAPDAWQSEADAACRRCVASARRRSEEHTSELQSLMRISYAVFCLKKKNNIDVYMNTSQQ